MNVSEAEAAIRAAFKNVRLDGGVSLRQGEVRDSWGRGATTQEYLALPAGEITEDWSALPFEALDHYPYLAHMDAKGFRYYIPAFMLSVLAAYDSSSMRVITTLSSLEPKEGQSWGYYMDHYSLLDRDQRSAIAAFLSVLAAGGGLEKGDQRRVDRALRDSWQGYLPLDEAHRQSSVPR